MTLYYCKDCPLIHDDCGPWDDECEFKTIHHTHKNHNGFQIGEPKLGGKTNWGHTKIEKEATIIFNQNIDLWFNELVVVLKSSEQICPIKDKWKWVSQS